MTEGHKEAILKFVQQKISQAELFDQLNIEGLMITDYALSQLEDAYKNNNAVDLEYALLLPGLKPTLHKFTNLFCQLIIENWHHNHEDIATYLQSLALPESIDSVYNAILNADQLEYLEYNNSAAFIRKCCYVLGDINTEYSVGKLKELSNSDNEIIKNYSIHQLKKRGREHN
jgi:hypothetical protein